MVHATSSHTTRWGDQSYLFFTVLIVVVCCRLHYFFFFLMIRPPPISTLFPSTPLFRSRSQGSSAPPHRSRPASGRHFPPASPSQPRARSVSRRTGQHFPAARPM